MMAGKRDRSTYEEHISSSYVVYGQPLPQSTPGFRDEGSYVPVWRQEVTDERGRKRLHGAFTGGFSAGYHNTVGSKEGWSPAAFVSSRGVRAKKAESRPEHFMDSEDLQEAAERWDIEVKKNFSGLRVEEPSLHGIVMDIFMPSILDTEGYQLLTKMGWQDNSGKSSVMDKRAKSHSSNMSTRCYPTISTAAHQSSNNIFSHIKQTRDLKGLGFESLRLSVQLDPTGLPQADSKSRWKDNIKKARGPLFGVGLLSEDDEEELYNTGVKLAYHNFTTGETGSKQRSTRRNIPLKGKPVFISKKAKAAKSSNVFNTLDNGYIKISGFLSTPPASHPAVQNHPLPKVPDGWLLGYQATSMFTNHHKPSSKIHDSRSRGALLGEVPLPGKSVFEFMTNDSRNRIASVTGNAISLAKFVPDQTSDRGNGFYSGLVPTLDESCALAALNGGFLPYSDDARKRGRYRAFLEVKSGQRMGLPEREYGMSTQDWINEMNEFASAARIFKPLSSSMAIRFTSPNTVDDSVQDIIRDSLAIDVLVAPQGKGFDPTADDSQFSTYGTQTRSTGQFVPSKLLSKRFNVHPITDQSSEVGGELWSKAATQANSETVPTVQDCSVQTIVIDPSQNRALEDEKVANDIFLEIFGEKH